MLIRGKKDEEEDVWVEKLLLRFRHNATGTKNSGETSLVQLREYVLSLEDVGDALEGVVM